MDKREQIFVSSTYIDLKDEREKVIQGLLEADCFPAGMEMFPASDAEKWDLIKGVIDDSDYYLLIIGARYGAVDAEDELSYTEKEYDYAIKQKKPIMAFVHAAPGTIAGDKTDLNDAKRAKLDAFRDKVQTRMVKLWTTGDQLPGFVAQALMKLRKIRPAVGWIRGDHAMTPEVRGELAELRQKVSAEVSRTDTPVFPDLEDGEDRLSFSAEVGFTTTKDPNADPEDNDVETEKLAGTIRPSVTWNELFSFLAPTLLHETSDRLFTSVLEDKLCEFISETRPTLDDFPNILNVWNAEVNQIDSVRDDVVVQFLALRLIERGVLRRGVNDKDRYWKLSQAGEDRMMQLRAKRKSLTADIGEVTDPLEQLPAIESVVGPAD